MLAASVAQGKEPIDIVDVLFVANAVIDRCCLCVSKEGRNVDDASFTERAAAEDVVANVKIDSLHASIRKSPQRRRKRVKGIEVFVVDFYSRRQQFGFDVSSLVFNDLQHVIHILSLRIGEDIRTGSGRQRRGRRSCRETCRADCSVFKGKSSAARGS